MRILFDSKKEEYKTPFGCLKAGENCTLHIDIPASCRTINVRLCIFDETGFEMLMPFVLETEFEGYQRFKTDFSLFRTGLYFYCFRIETEESNFSLYKQGNDTNIEDGALWQLTCYNADYEPPSGFFGRTMYQIFPDRFAKEGKCDLLEKLQPFSIHESTEERPVFTPDENGETLNNDFFGGNLKGIISRLPYLKKLGIGVIYLNPIFMAYSNHRYDTANYKKIDPMLGTEGDFVELCRQAHMLDIKIILDGVFSHTGSNSIYFDKNGVFGGGAFHNENSPYKSWYDFQEYPHKYTSWWGIDTLPCVNELDPAFMEYIITGEDSVVKHWIACGADGFRLDVVDEIPDEFVLCLKNELKKVKPDAILIGEVWEDASNKISYGKRRRYFADSELDSVMNYPFRDSIISLVSGKLTPSDFADSVMTITENYPDYVMNMVMNMLSTHDTPRLLTILGDVPERMSKAEKAQFCLEGENLEKAVALEKIAVAIQFTLPGMPCIYYGDEIGMEGFEDPLNRGFYAWENANRNLLEYYREIISLRNMSESLKIGKTRFVSAESDMVVFERYTENETFTVSVTLGAMPEKSGAASVFELRTPYGGVSVTPIFHKGAK